MSIDSNGNLHAPAGTPGGGRFAAQNRPHSSEVALAVAPAVPEPVTMPWAFIETGDEVLGDAGQSFGFVVRASVTDGVRRVHLHDGSAVRFDEGEDAQLTIRRRTEPLAYDPESHDYWANVAAIRDPRQSLAVLEQAAEAEAEDDFMLAIVEHPNVTHDLIEKASRHNSLVVRHAAVENPKTVMETLWRVKRDAERNAADEETLLRAEGISPNTQYRKRSIEANRNLAELATERLAQASTHD